jgi:hypothetical protein
MQTSESEHHWIVRLWRFIVLFLWLSAFIVAVALWAQSGELSEFMYSLVILSFIIIVTAVGTYDRFSVNIFGRMRKLSPESEQRFTLYSAVGLYLALAVVILFASLFVMKIMETPQIIVASMAGIECIVLLAIGYSGIARLR